MLRQHENDIIDAVVAKYPSAKVLKLSGNDLQDINGLEALAETLVKIDLSKNQLSLIGPLASLVNLKELSLEQNNISDIGKLSTLTNLEVLDLRGNIIAHTAQLREAVQHMSKLHTMHLTGNPIEGSVGYPDCIFDLQPTLQRVDHWIRESSQAPQSVDRASVITVALNASTDERVQALEAAFALQEEALSANGQDLAQLCASLTPLPIQQSVDASINHTELLVEFPYLRLLQLWRKQALDCTMQRTLAEQQLQRAVGAHKHDREQWQGKLRREEAEVLVLRQQVAAWEGRYHALQQALHSRDAALADVAQRAERAEAELLRLQDTVRKSEQYLTLFKAQADSRAVAQAAQVVQATDRLASYEERLTAAAQRVSFAAEVVAFKEVQLRNSAAAVEAERRLLHQRLATGVVRGGEEGDRDGNESQGESQSAPLSAEAEALLLAVFRSLDPHDNGCVSVQLLKEGLFQPFPSDRDGDDEAEQVVQPTTLGAMVAAALGESCWSNLSAALLNEVPAEADLSWGEVLLQLLPRSERRSDSTSDTAVRATTLSVADLRALRTLNLLGDGDWGVLPLQLPSNIGQCDGRPPSTSRSGTRSAGSEKASAEVMHLRKERSYLLQRLQRMGRQLERRAEGIRAYYEDTLRRDKIKIDRTSAELKETQAALAALRTQQMQVEDELHTCREQYQHCVSELQATVESLRADLERKQSEALRACRCELAVALDKSSQLEDEVTQLKSSSAKKDVKCRTLERSVTELRSSHMTAMAEIATLRENLAKATAEAELAAKEAQSASATLQAQSHEEQRRLLEVVAEQQASITALRQELAAAQEQAAEARSAAETAAQRQRDVEVLLRAVSEDYAAVRGLNLPGHAEGSAAAVTGGGDASRSAKGGGEERSMAGREGREGGAPAAPVTQSASVGTAEPRASVSARDPPRPLSAAATMARLLDLTARLGSV